jgi:hypothetical protein
MPAQDNIRQFRFQGLNDSTTNASEILPGEQPDWQCPLFQNMRLRQQGKAIQRRGQTPVGLGPYPDVQMLYWAKIGSQEFRLVVTSGSVVDDITGALSGGTNRFTPGTECNACWLNGQVIIGNGIDPNVRFDGSTVARLTVQPCNASGMVLTTGTSGAPSGTYQYLVVFLNADGIEGTFVGGDSDLSGLSSTITVTGNRVQLTNVPVCPAGQDCTGRHIYRNKNLGIGSDGNATSFFLVGTISNNTTTTFTDNVADADLGDELENFPNADLLRSANTPFPPCRYFAAHQGRLIGGYCLASDSDTRTVHYSDDLNPTTSRLVTYQLQAFMGGRIQLVDRAAGDITGISDSYGGVLLIFTGGEMYQWTGTDNLSLYLYPFAPHGCTSHRTITRYQNVVLWLAPDGVYTFVGTSQAVFTGTSFQRIIEDVRNTIDGMSASDMAQASAVISDSRYYLFWPNGSLVCDLLYGSRWYKDEPQRFGQATTSVFTSDNRARIYAFHPATSGIWQLETGITDNGQAIPCRLKTPDVPLAGPQMNATALHFGGLFRSSSDNVSGTLYRGTAQPVLTSVISLLSGSTNQDGLPLIGFDINQYPLNTVRMRQRTPTGIDPTSTSFALQFACDALSGQFEVVEGTIEFKSFGGWTGA